MSQAEVDKAAAWTRELASRGSLRKPEGLNWLDGAVGSFFGVPPRMIGRRYRKCVGKGGARECYYHNFHEMRWYRRSRERLAKLDPESLLVFERANNPAPTQGEEANAESLGS